jgi:Domain of unknown function (DUF6046)/Phage integrase SAM-like domain
LDTLRSRAINYQQEIFSEGKEFNVETIKEKWLDIKAKPIMLIDVFLEHNRKMKLLVGKEYAQLTYIRYETTLAHTKKFLLYKYGKEDMDVKKLDYSFINEFAFWLKAIRNCNQNSTTRNRYACTKKRMACGAGAYTDNKNKLVRFNDIKLVNVLINVSQRKNIDETEIHGMDGTIKEYIGMGDYELSIVGSLDGPNGHYPIDQVNALQQLCKAACAVDVVSRYLQNLDIHSIVIKEFAYDQEPGGYSSQKFSMEAISDVPILIQMN